MDYFYNSNEFSSRAKLSDKEKEIIFNFIYSIISIYKDIIEDKINHTNSTFINENYLLKLGIKYLKDTNIQKNTFVSNLYLIEKIGKNYILSGNYRGLDFIKKNIILDTIICIDAQFSEKLLKEKLLSICGEKFRKEYLIKEISLEGNVLNG
jgi:hypothetical protein